MTDTIIPFGSSAASHEASIVGGKGASLMKLYQAGIPVPDGFVITTKAYTQFGGGKTIPDDLKEAILTAFDTLGAARVAVRSSAVSEDSDTASWAGQFESFMNVTRDTLVDNIQNCWASVSDAISYAQTQDVSGDSLAIAVVVQKMVDSDVAGVAFSVNPINHDPTQIMIEATYGLGELLVQGMVNPDNYVIAKDDGRVVDERLSIKTDMLVYKDGQTQQVPVDQDVQAIACLNEEQLTELTQLVRRIEDYYDSPQDIEFAYSEGTLYIVQSRPITTV